MNRIDFNKSINFDDFDEAIVKYFDENAALYECIQGKHQLPNNLNISGKGEQDSKIIFDIFFESEEHAEYSLSNLTMNQNQSIIKYGIKFTIFPSLDGDNKKHVIIEMCRQWINAGNIDSLHYIIPDIIKNLNYILFMWI